MFYPRVTRYVQDGKHVATNCYSLLMLALYIRAIPSTCKLNLVSRLLYKISGHCTDLPQRSHVKSEYVKKVYEFSHYLPQSKLQHVLLGPICIYISFIYMVSPYPVFLLHLTEFLSKKYNAIETIKTHSSMTNTSIYLFNNHSVRRQNTQSNTTRTKHVNK